MAIVTLTDTWILENYAQVFAAAKVDELKESPPLTALAYFMFPGLSWRMQLYPRGENDTPNFAPFFVRAVFASEKESVSSVWAKWTLTVVAADTKANLQQIMESIDEYLKGRSSWGFSTALRQDALKTALNKDGHLEMKLDLTLFKIVDLLKCRETVRALLSANQHADVTINVEGKTYKAHKAILAKRCTGFLESVPVGTTADAYSAFLGALYCDSFDFLTNWKLAVGVLEISGTFRAEELRQYCDHALAEMVPSLSLVDLLHVLPVAVSNSALLSKSAIIGRLAKQEDLKILPEWASFKLATTKDILADLLFDLLQAKYSNSDSVPGSSVFNAAEIKLTQTWSIASADLLQAVAAQPTSVTSPVWLEHKAFPDLKWQLEFYPHGNSQDPDHKQEFASVYLKANFGVRNEDLKAVYVNWKATITTKNGTQVSTPVSPNYTLYTGAREMRYGYANAFPLEQYNEALISKTADPTKLSLDIRLDLTIANIPEILKCHSLISSLHSDKTYADVELDVSGVIFKAHKCILAVRSSTFCAMFETNMQEAASGKVEVKDTTPEAFKAFLAAVYCANWDFLLDMDATIDVLNLAERYNVADLKHYCDEALAHFANAANVLTILPHAALHNAEAAKSACVEVLCASEALMTSSDWIAFKRANKEIAYDIAEAMAARCRSLLKRKREDD